MTAEEVTRLCHVLDNGPKSYYVYALCFEDGTPFYIGKGRDARVFAHEQDAMDAADVLGQIAEDSSLSAEEKAVARERLSAKIQTIIAANGRIKRVIIKWGLTCYESFMCEAALINMLRFIEGRTVSALTNIANGHASEPEKKNSADVKSKARIVELFLKECAAEKRATETLSDKRIVYININRLYDQCIDMDGHTDRNKVKDTVRGLWRMSLAKAEQVEYVFALYRQRVVGIYHVTRPPRRLRDERAQGFPDFPSFPERVRRMDRLKACADTLEGARNLLPEAEYAELVADLAAFRPGNPPSRTFAEFQHRIYFVVDDNVPEEVRAFENCYPTLNGTTDFIRKGAAQYGSPVFNF